MGGVWLASLLAIASGQDLFLQRAPLAATSSEHVDVLDSPPYPVPAPSPPEAKSFTVHVIHRPQDRQSVLAKDVLRTAFCKEFEIAPCVVSQSNDESILRLTDDLVVSAPYDKFQAVVAFLQQHRVARLNPPATVDLDLMVHPNTDAGPRRDFQFGLWAGNEHPVDMNAVYKSRSSVVLAVPTPVATTTDEDEDKWAYTCSYDASGQGQWANLCGNGTGPFALNTTCRSTSAGAHLHFFFSEANVEEVRAKEVFYGMATKALNLSLEICHDNYGHEQLHNTTCWLGGPTNLPPKLGVPAATSFVESSFSIFVANHDFARVVSWVMLHDVAEVLGTPLNYLLHPVFGCNFADHQMWSLHKGSVPNNMVGIESEGGWTGSSPPRLDPFGPEAGATCGCSSPSVHSYALHLLYSSADEDEVVAKDKLVGKISNTFDKSLVQLVQDTPESFLDSTSQFLAGQVHFKVTVASYAKVMDWLASERGSTDVLMVPVTCCGQQWDYAESGVWAGRRWPLNVAALQEKPSSDDFMMMVELYEESPEKTHADHNFLLYVNYASENPYQAAAAQKFISAFAAEFSLNRSSCTAQYPAAEPSYANLCMMNEVPTPTSADPVMTGYAAVYVPVADVARVMSWAMLHRSADIVGYQVDLLMVPMLGNAFADYGQHSFHVGAPWTLNNAALFASTSSGATAALDLPASVHYYRGDNVDQLTALDNGATVERWMVTSSLRTDLFVAPPFVVRHTIPVGETFPSWGGDFYYTGDSHSTVITGNASFGNDTKVYGYGDLFWAMAGHAQGPITNIGSTPLVVVTVSPAPLLARRGYDVASDENPSVVPVTGCAANLIRSRDYRRVDGNWSANPSLHTTECMSNGGVWNMGFDTKNNSGAALRVRWAPNCSIPYHYHPTGALYFIQYGKMFFKGDLATGGDDVAFSQGEVRWVRPGFDYGPEYNSANESMEITVLGTETPPMFQSPPPGPYKYQKVTYATTVFDEL
jgi:aromatic ring-cleaving dioxygenase